MLREKILFSVALAFAICSKSVSQQCSGCIDRQALVKRHNVFVNRFDTLGSLSVGNGEFAFTVDATGLQTFPELYEKGIPLGTQSQWGWHSFPNKEGYRLEECFKEYDFHGRKIPYASQPNTPARKKEASNFLRINPHRLHLGIVGLDIEKPDGYGISVNDISDIHQTLNLWKGEIHSSFKVLGSRVEVFTYCHSGKDVIGVKVVSPLVRKGLLKIKLHLPYPTGGHVDSGCDWTKPDSHKSILTGGGNQAIVEHRLDSTCYIIRFNWSNKASMREKAPHYFVLEPKGREDTIAFSCGFYADKSEISQPGFQEISENSSSEWKNYWMKGGMVDFSGSTDARASELERRIVLSQYLTRIQCAGTVPPQETGLTCNSWYGKFHLEMHWWHAAHFAFWNHPELLEKSMDWYREILPKAKEIANRQGFDGARWPKMTDETGNDCPSSVGSVLIWQQPHIIYFAESIYRLSNDPAILEKYKELVFETARFMASYAWYEKEKDRYILGPGLIPAQECFDAATTFNPPFELEYWYWGISVAQKWLERLHLPRNKQWDEVLAKLSVLAQEKGIYLVAGSVPDCYSISNYTTDHPAVLGAFGMLPGSRLVDKQTMEQTFNFIWNHWQWEDTWGWDFPLTAMSATRLGMPEKAVDALFMKSLKNTYLPNGHNFQDARLRLYLPGNGGLLSAVAMMCAGYDGCKEQNPGFPKNGKWIVKWENIKPLP